MKKAILILNFVLTANVFAAEAFYCINDNLHELSTGKIVREVQKSDGGGCAEVVKKAKDGLYCAGDYESDNGSLREVRTGKELRFMFSMGDGCKSALSTARGGFYCRGYYLKNLRTGESVRTMSREHDGRDCDEVLRASSL